MAVALQRLVRRALLTRLKADAALVAAVSKASINPLGVPTWPFVILRAPRTRRLRATGVNAGTVAFDIHAFARDREDAGQVVETGEDHAGRIGGLIETALADTRITFEGVTMRVSLSDMRLIDDGEPGAWHYFAQVNVRVLAG
ncbi:DUF3168 domain-containing protein [Novosphingobium olei]|uniref:DUF3168 domain-containing protein n=1 Tax=Novosphingobium olei TaxID=2728851 RepID=UPI003090E461|nr:DUF3168 domain-containing protein [Novosphingobium olei]